MPLITDRQHVLDIYAEAASLNWVVPCFCSENLTTNEAVLAAAKEYGKAIGQQNLPVTLAITNQYAHRAQSSYYTHTRQWELGLRLFMAELAVLTAPGSPFENLRVMLHLDHTQYDSDLPLLAWNMGQFSSIMYDASALPFDDNIKLTRRFVEEHGTEIVIEGACDEIVDAGGNEVSAITTPEHAQRYINETGVDLLVANLGTEHRASSKELHYQGDMARQISALIGAKIVLHGCSSVPATQVQNLFNDGVCKVNIWTMLERDSSPLLLEAMTRDAAKVAGASQAQRLLSDGILGVQADTSSRAQLSHFTTVYRQDIIFAEMKRIVGEYLTLWYK